MAESDLDAIGLLRDPARRALYAFVVAQGRDVSRNEAAEAVGLPRTLAAFHLDRLASGGLLDIAYQRVNGRAGPGAGRPAKLYRRSTVERAVSLPPRDYLRMSRVFAEAIEHSGAEAALYAAARADGVAAGQALAHSTAAPSPNLGDVERDLTERGYEPYPSESGVRLRNCPFHVVAQEFPVVVCGMNLALLEGMLTGSGLAETHAARLRPRPGECCVAIVLK